MSEFSNQCETCGSKPTIHEKNNLPVDVRYAFNEGVELYQAVKNYEDGIIGKDEFIDEIRSIKEKYQGCYK